MSSSESIPSLGVRLLRGCWWGLKYSLGAAVILWSCTVTPNHFRPGPVLEPELALKLGVAIAQILCLGGALLAALRPQCRSLRTCIGVAAIIEITVCAVVTLSIALWRPGMWALLGAAMSAVPAGGLALWQWVRSGSGGPWSARLPAAITNRVA